MYREAPSLHAYIEDIHHAVLHSLAIGRAGEPTYPIVFFGDPITKSAVGHKLVHRTPMAMLSPPPPHHY